VRRVGEACTPKMQTAATLPTASPLPKTKSHSPCNHHYHSTSLAQVRIPSQRNRSQRSQRRGFHPKPCDCTHVRAQCCPNNRAKQGVGHKNPKQGPSMHEGMPQRCQDQPNHGMCCKIYSKPHDRGGKMSRMLEILEQNLQNQPPRSCQRTEKNFGEW
jgi:hypothetical protein